MTTCARGDLDGAEAKIELFLSDLAVNRHVAASTQNQAFNALVFLYPQVLHQDLQNIQAVRVPVVLTAEEAKKVITSSTGEKRSASKAAAGLPEGSVANIPTFQLFGALLLPENC